VAVEDEGPGIPLAERRKIWESFYRLEREERQVCTGSGIGLAIVRQLATEMGGGVHVEAGASGGARFVVWFPATHSEDAGDTR
jgi:two-component system OmpR family sensor kinase